MMTGKEVIQWFSMLPNDAEGGYFASTYTSSTLLDSKRCLRDFPPAEGKRTLCSAIFYLIEGSGCSVMHQVSSDMLYHFYSGDPVQMLLLYPGNPRRAEVCTFSNNIAAGGIPMKVIPGGTWLGSRLTPGGDYALMGVSMAPGFDPSDYVIGDRATLISQYPNQADLITDLTKPPQG